MELNTIFDALIIGIPTAYAAIMAVNFISGLARVGRSVNTPSCQKGFSFGDASRTDGSGQSVNGSAEPFLTESEGGTIVKGSTVTVSIEVCEPQPTADHTRHTHDETWSQPYVSPWNYGEATPEQAAIVEQYWAEHGGYVVRTARGETTATVATATWDTMTVTQLRAECNRLGIRWNRASKLGSNRHASKSEMVEWLSCIKRLA